MKRNLVLIVLLIVFAVVSTGCMAGSWAASETVDDWAAGVYADDAYIGTVVYVFVWPIGKWLGGIVDMVVTNNVDWWGYDVWDGKGTTFNHADAPNGEGNDHQHILEGMGGE
ncbi:MAG: DUF3332 family protein [Planctomycetota bacterium]|jgi:hypothetical protein